MRIAYFDCFSGICSEMALGALVDAGADLGRIADAVRLLPLQRFWIEREEVEVRGIAATRIHLRSEPAEVIRTYASVRAMLEDSGLPSGPKRSAQLVFKRLAEAEGRVRGKEPDLVTFHEYGELDSVVEIVGCALALDMLKVDRVFSSPIPTGLGMIRTEHGMMPVPGPVVLDLLRGVPTYSRGTPAELVTATGAAILAAVAEGYGEMPMMRSEEVGYGAGHLRLDFPNVLRVVIGAEEIAGQGADLPGSDMLVQTLMEALDQEGSEALLERMYQAGARDAWLSPAVGRGGLASMTLSAVVPGSWANQVVEGLAGEPQRIGSIRTNPVTLASGPSTVGT
jgi:pyridinium-3,5-bisthiocarboxylic acid mononucleotide nickel chelatase